MVDQVMEVLQPKAGEIVADCTLGYGGHASEFARRIGSSGRLIGLDLDAAQLERTSRRLAGLGVPVSVHHSNYAGLANLLAKEGHRGVRHHLCRSGCLQHADRTDPSRGFSYKHEGPLDMRMDSRLKKTAADLVNSLAPDKLSDALLELADEPDHDRIADAVVRRRQLRPHPRQPSNWRTWCCRSIRAYAQSSGASGQPGRCAICILAARTFQALRILVNDELGSPQCSSSEPRPVLPEGRREDRHLLTFHSGEDLLVERAFCDRASRTVRTQPSARSPFGRVRREVGANPRAPAGQAALGPGARRGPSPSDSAGAMLAQALR